MPARLALVDYGAGNLRSVANALAAVGAEAVRVTADPGEVAAADRVILPGVGAFGACVGALRAIPGMEEALNAAVIGRGAPFLGICVGMQLMAEEGREHGVHRGLGWLPGHVDKLAPADPDARVPHMGWNDVRPAGHLLLEAGEAYFTHSYALRCRERDHALAVTDHGGEVVAAAGRDNMLGVQFHPEKSQGYGLRLLKRFLKWRP